jgi:YfiH family protein
VIRPLVRDGIFLGSQFETGRAHFFFGSAQLGREQLPHFFPDYKFCFLKQVHGHKIVHGDPAEVFEADGHFTGKPHHALVIQTGDCVPLMLANSAQVCALHAGWRGTAAGIVGTAKVFLTEPPEVAVIGPHIRSESFEIGRDVSEALLDQVPPKVDRAQFLLPHKDPAKCYFDLSALLKSQLRTYFPEIQIFEAGENTFTSSAYHSFRRDKNGAGRQYSFVVLKP